MPKILLVLCITLLLFAGVETEAPAAEKKPAAKKEARVVSYKVKVLNKSSEVLMANCTVKNRENEFVLEADVPFGFSGNRTLNEIIIRKDGELISNRVYVLNKDPGEKEEITYYFWRHCYRYPYNKKIPKELLEIISKDSRILTTGASR